MGHLDEIYSRFGRGPELPILNFFPVVIPQTLTEKHLQFKQELHLCQSVCVNVYICSYSQKQRERAWESVWERGEGGLWATGTKPSTHANHVLQGRKSLRAHIRIEIPNTSRLLHRPLHNQWIQMFPVNDKMTVQLKKREDLLCEGPECEFSVLPKHHSSPRCYWDTDTGDSGSCGRKYTLCKFQTVEKCNPLPRSDAVTPSWWNNYQSQIFFTFWPIWSPQ